VGRQIQGLALRAQGGTLARPAAPAPAPTPAATPTPTPRPSPASIPEPATLDDFYALPDGAIFVRDGRLYRKRGDNAELIQ
jgi:hypothetical protein